MDIVGGPARLFERAAVWLRERKVLLPGVSTLTRLVSEVRAGANERLYAVLVDAAGPALIRDLEGLLRVEDGSRLTEWERLRTGPSRVSVPELLRQLDRLARLRTLGAGTIDVETVPTGRMNALARYGLAGKASALQGLSGQRRGATLLCAVRALTTEVADDNHRCGPGQWTNFIQTLGVSVEGVDLVPEFVDEARGRYPGVAFRVGCLDMLEVPDRSVAGILAWYSVIHTPPDEIDCALTEFARCIAPYGSLLLGFFEGHVIEAFPHAVTPRLLMAGR